MTKKRARQQQKKGAPSSRGLMSGMRFGMKRMVGVGGPDGPKKQSPLARYLNIALWVAVGIALLVLLLRVMGKF